MLPALRVPSLGYHAGVLKRVLLPLLLGLALPAAGGTGAESREDSLSGTLGYVFTESPAGDEIRWGIHTATRDVRVEFPAEIVASAGGLSGLAGRKVSLSGRSYGDTFVAHRIGWFPKPTERPTIPKVGTDSLSGTRPQIFILAKFKDVATTPHPQAWYQTWATGAAPSLRDYFLEQSYGAWDIAGSQVTTWVTLPKTKAQYATTGGNGIGVDDEAVVKDALAAADPQVDFRKFDGFHVLLNDAAGNIGGTGGRGTYTLDGETRLWGRTYDNNGGGMLGLLAHEMGHSFGFDHSSGPYKTPYDSGWDQMSRTGNWNRVYADYGAYPQHTNAYHRIVTGLIPRDRIVECLPGTTKTVKLTRLVQPADGFPLVARIFVGGDANKWLTVEARRRVGDYEQGVTLPDEGVILHDCDPTHMMVDVFSGILHNGPVSYVIDPDNNSDPNDAAATWKTGEMYTDAPNGIAVTILKMSATGFDVKVTVAPNQPSPAVVTSGKDSGGGSLRSALAFANLFPNTKIEFAAPASALTSGELVVKPITPLPEITGTGTIIDGTSQTLLADTNPGMPEVAVDGTGAGAGAWGHGLVSKVDKVTFKGVSVRKFPYAGIYLTGAPRNAITACAVGTDRTGKTAQSNGWAGVVAENGSNNLTVTDLLASGNGADGLLVRDSDGLKVKGGKFGTDMTGNAALGNKYRGLYAENVKGLAIGSNLDVWPVFSGSTATEGFLMKGCSDVAIANVRVGTNLAGTAALPNFYSGAWIENCVGMTIKNSQFSGNKSEGVVFKGTSDTATVLTACLLGTDATGTKALGNGNNGAWIEAPGVDLTNCTASGNKGGGLVLINVADSVVKNCKAGTDKTGTFALLNGYKGIAVDKAGGWTVTGSILSGNAQEGIGCYRGAGPGMVKSCRIGLGAKGEKLGSPYSGVWIGDNSHDIAIMNNQIANNAGNGVAVGLSANVAISGCQISDHANTGVAFYGGAVNGSLTNTEIRRSKYQGVSIGDAATHDIAVTGILSDSNDWGGIAIYGGAHHNRIDGNTVINYNGCGISMQDSAHDNTVINNVVGCNKAAPAVALNTGWGGIGVWKNAYANKIGDIGVGNLVGPGDQIGVYVNDANTVGNSIRGNVFMGATRQAIDLGGDGGDANDANDGDAGPNRKQNYPTLSKDTFGSTVKIAYQGAASRTILVDLYAVDATRNWSSGPGYAYLGTVEIKTSAFGSGNATFTLPAGVAVVTATATDKASGDTSEFCRNLGS